MNGTRMTDQELTAAYEAYRDMVYRIALATTKSAALAEDIQQDVFMALVRYSDRIRSEAHIKPWLIRVTVNACRKHFRSMWIKKTVLYDDALYKEQEQEDGLAVSAPPGSDPGGAEEDEEAEVLRETVEKLPENSRTVIHLFYYEELSVREIAQTLGITEQNVKTRLSRARDQLRQRIGRDSS